MGAVPPTSALATNPMGRPCGPACISAWRPCSAAPTATRNATVTVSASSRPVVRLTTVLDMISPYDAGGLLHTIVGGAREQLIRGPYGSRYGGHLRTKGRY